MTKYNTSTPYIASYLIIRDKGKIAFVLRTNTGWMNNYYGLPSGKVEIGENFSSAVIREGLEEIGVKIKLEDLKFVHLMHRREETDWVDAYFEAGKYEGEAYNAEPDIHSELAWFDPNNLPDNVVTSVKQAIERIEAGSFYSEYGWPA